MTNIIINENKQGSRDVKTYLTNYDDFYYAVNDDDCNDSIRTELLDNIENDPIYGPKYNQARKDAIATLMEEMQANADDDDDIDANDIDEDSAEFQGLIEDVVQDYIDSLDDFTRFEAAVEFREKSDSFDVNWISEDIFDAVENDDIDALNNLLLDTKACKGTWYNMYNDNGYLPLHVAAENNSIDVLNYIIEAGANVNAMTNERDDKSALEIAVDAGNIDVVEILLNYKPTAVYDIIGSLDENDWDINDDDDVLMIRCIRLLKNYVADNPLKN